MRSLPALPAVLAAAVVLAPAPVPAETRPADVGGATATLERRSAPARTPSAGEAVPVRRRDLGMPAAPVIVFGLLSAGGLAAVAMLVRRLVHDARRNAIAPSVESTDACIEAELQAMISEANACTLRPRAP